MQYRYARLPVIIETAMPQSVIQRAGKHVNSHFRACELAFTVSLPEIHLDNI
jgi:hypothetical protein